MELVRAATTTGSNESTRPPKLRLPPGLVDRAASRLCWISLLSAVTTVAMFAGQLLFQPEVVELHKNLSFQLSTLILFLVSAGFMGLQRAGWFSKQTILLIGVGYQVVVSFGIAMLETAMPLPPDQLVRGVSSLALWITFCGLLIPNAPLLTLLGAVASSLMWPAAYFLNGLIFDYPPIPMNRFAIVMLPLVLMSIWTYILNARLYAMEVKMQKAEEMGSYQLDYMIGRGGMGEVWRARHRMLARDAAIKLIRPEVLSSQSVRQVSVIRKRFEREAKTTASLRSPHTVALFDFGQAQDQSFYYVMELLDGIDLQTMVERFGPLPAGRARHLLLGVCESLEEAHRNGLVHRDIKPKNIFAARLGMSYDFAKVLDFGLVKTMLTNEATLMTMEGTATGTPAYMAPEIAIGEDKIDGRADIYSLGCVAYFLLTGQMVFNENNPTALALAHVQKVPVPPSQRTELPIPPAMEALILQCLDKDPKNRPRSAQEVARRLSEVTGISEWSRVDAVAWWQTNLPETAVQPVGPTTESFEELVSSRSVL